MLPMSGKAWDYIEEYAARFKERPDDFNPYDASGGNFDDAFEMGVTQGVREACFDILALLNGKTHEDQMPKENK